VLTCRLLNDNIELKANRSKLQRSKTITNYVMTQFAIKNLQRSLQLADSCNTVDLPRSSFLYP